MPENKQEQNLTPEQIAQIAAQASANAIAQVVADKAANANEASFRINDKIRQKQIAQQNYANRIRYEMDHNINCMTITIPEMYKKWQPSFTVSINGCTVNIPADGKPYLVHNDFAVLIMKRMRRLSYKVAHLGSNDVTEYNRD